jgi:hypothetical protein
MKSFGRRLAVGAAAAMAPMGFMTIATPAVSSAACNNTEWWDPVGNVCRPLVTAPLDCENGSWWDPVANVCREPIVVQPQACEFGSYWDPVGNVCRTVFVLPPP